MAVYVDGLVIRLPQITYGGFQCKVDL